MKLLAALFGLVLPGASLAAEWFVSPIGAAQGDGSRARPWDLASTLAGVQKIQPGDTVNLMPGVYRRRPQERFEVKLAGAEGKPIVVRSSPGSRAVIDGGLLVQSPSAHLWIRDLEITVTEPDESLTKPVEAGSWPESYKRPWGGLEVVGGTDCKFINLVIHHCRQGIGLWKDALRAEVYGCIIYDNGWVGTDRGHGHALYTQNETGVKRISDCIMTGGRSYTLHAYGSERAFVDNYEVTGNFVFNGGTFLIGGGRPSRGIVVKDNFLYGVQMRLGYDAPHNEDCVITGNIVLNDVLRILNFRQARNENNLVAGGELPVPEEPIVRLRPNKYDSTRAQLAVFSKSKKASADLSGWAKPGETVAFHDPRNLLKPLHTAKWQSAPLPLPMLEQFACYVLIRRR